jgi:hypothetical protein
MRTYIFTPLERKILRSWLNGETTLKDIRLRKVLSRIKLFKDLSIDVDLYLLIRRRLAETKTTVSA